MSNKPRKYSDADLTVMKTMRADGKTAREIGEVFQSTAHNIRNVLLYHEGRSGERTLDVMPRQIRKWPSGIDFGPDELQLESWA